jgi:hypothetical protein
MSQITITVPIAADKPDWRRLYDGYASFYKMPMNDAIADCVWDLDQRPGTQSGGAGRQNRYATSRQPRPLPGHAATTGRQHRRLSPCSSIPNSAVAESPSSSSRR